jgi:predicted dehydrogenase
MTIESSNSADAGSRIRLGMVGGGRDAFIGAVHRIAARIDDEYVFVAGALSADAAKARASAADLGLDADRAYSDYEIMAKAEAARDDGIDAVAIVTPNHMHYPVARAFLEAGIHVICDKPLTTTVADSESLVELARQHDRIFAVTYNYSGTPLVRQARSMIANGELGELRVVNVEYVQDWLSTRLEESGQKQAAWRTDPERSGAGGCIGDIGTHAYHLACFVTGLEVEELSAELTTFVAGRQLDDNAQIMLRFKGGARGLLWASQVAPGNENGLTLRVYGDKGGLEWHQENPNVLMHSPLGEPTRVITRAGTAANEAAQRVSRIPAGHPEGYLEAFAILYKEVAAAIRAHANGTPPGSEVLFPTVVDGLSGVRFVSAAVQSSNAGATWTKLPN